MPAWWRARAEVSELTRREVDVADPVALEATLTALAPDLILNCAAYNDVDAAETDSVTALAVNAMAVRSLAAFSGRIGATLVHYSTDFVFDGLASEPYTEASSPRPQSVYGASKREGERAVLAGQSHSVILRTAWVISAHRSNFLKTMLRLAATNPTLRVVDDQHRCPRIANMVDPDLHGTGR